MPKVFNVNGVCRPDRHYMVDLTSRLEKIRAMVDNGLYFTINRGRQYGKTTTLHALADFLKNDYLVVSMDFQRIGAAKFKNENTFSVTFAREFIKKAEKGNQIDTELFTPLKQALSENRNAIELYDLFEYLTEICEGAEKPIVLMIDEVDSASNNQVFLDFLAQLRASYLEREDTPTFQSVILAGVYDIRNIKRRIRPDEEHKVNSPWNTREGNEENGSLLTFDDCPRDQKELAPFNIAADFLVEMSFSVDDIAGMLKEYEAGYHTGMNVAEMSKLLYDHTSGYPVLVSWLCKCLDENIAGTVNFPDKSSAWTEAGFMEALKLLLQDQNALFESLLAKLTDFPELNDVILRLLFQGEEISYTPDDPAVQNAQMFGFVKTEGNHIVIANRIFETRLYNYYLLKLDEQNTDIYSEGARQKNQFIIDGHLNMRRVLEKFVETFDYLYGDRDETFLEEEGRRYFMLFLKPIINGTGNCYVEPETRNRERMDLVIDYRGEQFVCELKIWHGNAYRERGEEQLVGYLDYFHLKKGYLLSFNFNKKKEIGVRDIVLGDRVIVEAVV